MAGSDSVREPGLGPLNERWVLATASELLPGLDRGRASLEFGVEHVVVVAPEVGVVRISRAPGNRPVMERRVELLSELGRAGLPFAVPEPLSEVAVVDGYAVIALSWLPGEPRRTGYDDPAPLRQLLAALRQVDIGVLSSALAPPHGYAGGAQWAELMTQAITRLPPDVRGRPEDASTRPWRCQPYRLRWSTVTSPAPTCTGPRTASSSASWTGTGHRPGTRPSMPPASAGTAGQPFKPL